MKTKYEEKNFCTRFVLSKPTNFSKKTTPRECAVNNSSAKCPNDSLQKFLQKLS